MRHPLSPVLLSITLAACSGGSSEHASVTPERTPVPPPATTADPPPATPEAPPEAPEAPPPPTERATVDIDARTLARRWVREHEHEVVTLGGGCVTAAPLYPSATLRERAETLLTSAAQEVCSSFPDARAQQGFEVDNVLATPSLLSVTWTATWTPDSRGAWDERQGASRHYSIADGELHRFAIEDALRMDVVDRVVSERCAQQMREAAAEHADDRYYEARDVTCGTRAWLSLGTHSIIVEVTLNDWYTTERVEVPYSDLPGAIIDGGPLARMLRIGTAAPAVPAATGDAWAVTGLAPIAELAMRWAVLPEALRSALRVAGDDPEQGRLALPPEADEESAAAIARALGETPSRIPWPERPRALELARTRTSLNLRSEPSGTPIRAIPIGTVAVVLEESQSGSSPWTRIVVGPSMVGWVSSRFLEHADCLPSLDELLASLPADARPLARTQTIRIDTHGVSEGRVVRAALFASSITLEERAATHVSLRRLSSACRVGAELGAWDVAADLDDVQATRTARTGGDVLLVVDAGSTWRAYRVGSHEPVWQTYTLRVGDASGVLAPGTHGPHGRGFWPLVTRHRAEVHAFRWDGATLVPDDEPPAAPQAPTP